MPHASMQGTISFIFFMLPVAHFKIHYSFPAIDYNNIINFKISCVNIQILKFKVTASSILNTFFLKKAYHSTCLNIHNFKDFLSFLSECTVHTHTSRVIFSALPFGLRSDRLLDRRLVLMFYAECLAGQTHWKRALITVSGGRGRGAGGAWGGSALSTHRLMPIGQSLRPNDTIV